MNLKMKINRVFLVIMLSIGAFCSCGELEVDYYHFRFHLQNLSTHSVHVEWEFENMKGVEKSFDLAPGEEAFSQYAEPPTPVIKSATITFDDGKVLRYSQDDHRLKRSLCNEEFYYRLYSGDNIHWYFILTDKDDYALAVMPNEE